MFKHLGFKHPLGLAFRYLQHEKLRLSNALFWRALFVVLPMQIPLLTGVIVDALSSEASSLYGWNLAALSQLEVLQIVFFGLLLIAFIYGFVSYMNTISRAQLSRHFVSSLRVRIINKATLLSLDQQQAIGSGELLSRVITDAATMRRFLDRVFIQTLSNVLKVVYPVVMLLVINSRLALIAIAVLPIQVGITHYLQKNLHHTSRERRKTLASLTTNVKENLDAAETLHMTGATQQAISTMTAHSYELEKDELRTNHYAALISATVWLLTSLGLALTWKFGASTVVSGQMSTGNLVAFMGFVILLYQPFRMLTRISNTYKRGLVALEHIHNLLETSSSLEEVANATELQVTTTGHIRLENVSMHYSKRAVLHNVNLEVMPRQLTALVGKSGSGKSTMLKLMARLYDPTEGKVFIENQNLKELSLESIRKIVVGVPQRPKFFTGTLHSNLLLSCPDASDDELEAACRAANAWDFITSLEEGLSTPIGDTGQSLSGGQLQRLAIARALLKHPKLLLLDEPSSALDTEAEAELIKTLKQLSQSLTVVVVAHRLETVRHADTIIVMDEGEVTATGNHDKLLMSSALYGELFGQVPQLAEPNYAYPVV